mgnify:CR=1 FL=1
MKYLLVTFLNFAALGFLFTLFTWLCQSLLHRYNSSTNPPVKLTTLFKECLLKFVGWSALTILYIRLGYPFHQLSTIDQIFLFSLFYLCFGMCNVVYKRHKLLKEDNYFQVLVWALTTITCGMLGILIHQHLLS